MKRLVMSTLERRPAVLRDLSIVALTAGPAGAACLQDLGADAVLSPPATRAQPVAARLDGTILLAPR